MQCSFPRIRIKETQSHPGTSLTGYEWHHDVRSKDLLSFSRLSQNIIRGEDKTEKSRVKIVIAC